MLEHAGSMHLDCALADPEVMSNHPIDLATDQGLKYLTLARTKPSDAPSRVFSLVLSSGRGGACQRRLYGCKQVLRIERLLYEVNRTSFQRSYSHFDITLPSEEDQRECNPKAV
jgi:hypothetical protein